MIWWWVASSRLLHVRRVKCLSSSYSPELSKPHSTRLFGNSGFSEPKDNEGESHRKTQPLRGRQVRRLRLGRSRYGHRKSVQENAWWERRKRWDPPHLRLHEALPFPGEHPRAPNGAPEPPSGPAEGTARPGAQHAQAEPGVPSFVAGHRPGQRLMVGRAGIAAGRPRERPSARARVPRSSRAPSPPFRQAKREGGTGPGGRQPLPSPGDPLVAGRDPDRACGVSQSHATRFTRERPRWTVARLP